MVCNTYLTQLLDFTDYKFSPEIKEGIVLIH